MAELRTVWKLLAQHGVASDRSYTKHGVSHGFTYLHKRTLLCL